MISIIHPSRGRPEQALKTACHWLGNMSKQIKYSYTLSIDSGDPELKTYLDLFDHKLVSDNKNIVDAVNVAARFAVNGNPDIFIVISDDFECFENWDMTISYVLQGKSGVLKIYDGIQKWIVTLPIMTRDYYESQGYIYHPSYFHMFSDSDQTHKADLQKKLIIRNDIVFKHNHYSIGGQPKDEVNKKADSTWAQGEKVYLQRCKEKFGLGNVNIYDLSPEATKAGHVAWLKKKLR